MSQRDPDPIQPTRCPACQQPARQADQRTEFVKDRPYVCDPCDLWFAGTATEFQRYRVAEAVAAAEAMTTRPNRNEER